MGRSMSIELYYGTPSVWDVDVDDYFDRWESLSDEDRPIGVDLGITYVHDSSGLIIQLGGTKHESLSGTLEIDQNIIEIMSRDYSTLNDKILLAAKLIGLKVDDYEGIEFAEDDLGWFIEGSFG